MCQTRLKGSTHIAYSHRWGLLGRMNRGIGTAVCKEENKIRRILNEVVSTHDSEFPDIAVTSLQKLVRVRRVADAPATLLPTLARPDRLVRLNDKSQAIASYPEYHSNLAEPNEYRELPL